MERQTLIAETATLSPIRRIGERALWAAGVFKHELGVNDPLTHLEQYLEHGEGAIGSIDEDLITDCAERMVKPTFINPVKFDRVGSDFVSRENKFSMRSMTSITETKFAGNVSDILLYKRAKIESKEVDRLNGWFAGAKINDAFIVESMGLTESEGYTIVRIHQKSAEDELVEHVITLHNATAGTFNQLHHNIGAEVPDSQTPLELLDNMYAYSPAEDQFDDFVEKYVSAYDAVLATRDSGKEYSFGLPKTEDSTNEDDITAIRRQTSLRSIYTGNVRALGRSGGYVTTEIARINEELKLGMDIIEGRPISTAEARYLLDSSLQYIVATFNRASKEHLESLATGGRDGAAESAGSYGGDARAEGTRYEGACPSGSAGAAASEAAAVAHSNRTEKDPSRCGHCPKCSKEYYVPDEIYKDKIISCGNCKAAIYFDGRRVDEKTIQKYYGESQKQELSPMAVWWRRENHKSEIKKLNLKAETAETDFEGRRIANLILQEEINLLELEKVA